jgi:predicted dehydrogenase
VVRWGFLATGWIADQVAEESRPSPDVELAAVGSRDIARAHEFARRHGFARAHGSYDDLVADPEIDAVYVSVPNALHVEWTIRALEAGKHVLCEKPFTRHPDDAARAYDVAEREGRLLVEGFMYRHLPLTQRLLDLAASEIGPVRFVRSSWRYLLDGPNIATDLELEGGALMAVGSYGVHLARAILGEPERVYAEPVVGPTGADVLIAGTLRYAHGAVAQFDGGLVFGSYEQAVEVVGETGSLLLDDPWYGRGSLLLRRSRKVEELLPEVGLPYRRQLEHVGAVARGETEPLLGRDDAVAQACALAALHASMQERRPVDLRT